MTEGMLEYGRARFPMVVEKSAWNVVTWMCELRMAWETLQLPRTTFPKSMPYCINSDYTFVDVLVERWFECNHECTHMDTHVDRLHPNVGVNCHNRYTCGYT